jgi:hypothetical protein
LTPEEGSDDESDLSDSSSKRTSKQESVIGADSQVPANVIRALKMNPAASDDDIEEELVVDDPIDSEDNDEGTPRTKPNSKDDIVDDDIEDDDDNDDEEDNEDENSKSSKENTSPKRKKIRLLSRDQTKPF